MTSLAMRTSEAHASRVTHGTRAITDRPCALLPESLLAESMRPGMPVSAVAHQSDADPVDDEAAECLWTGSEVDFLYARRTIEAS